MISTFFEYISKNFKVKELDCGKFSKIKTKALTMNVKSYEVDGIGEFSILDGKTIFGLMKIKTIVFNIKNKDIPLFAYDFIGVLFNRIDIIEYYNTCSNLPSDYRLKQIKDSISSLKEKDLGNHWYDSIKLDYSFAKSIKKKNIKELNNAFEETMEELVNIIKNSKNLTNDEILIKNEKTKKYVDDLIKNGGPSTDLFIKLFGENETKDFYYNVFFRV